jgi:hypothetical protein
MSYTNTNHKPISIMSSTIVNDSIIAVNSATIAVTMENVGEINKLLRKEAQAKKQKKYCQYKWNKFTQTFEQRWFFRTWYQNAFKKLNYYLRFRQRPVVGYFDVRPVLQPEPSLQSWDSRESVEEVDAFVFGLRWGVKYEWPEMSRTDDEGYDEEKFKYTYFYFENGRGGYDCAFSEDNSCEYTYDNYTPLFHRAYASLDSVIYPMFHEPGMARKQYPWNSELKRNEKECVEYFPILHLQRGFGEEGMTATTTGNHCHHYQYTNNAGKRVYEVLQYFERKALVDFYESTEEDYGDYYD